MKKNLFIQFAFISLAFCLSGCSSNEDVVSNNEEQTTPKNTYETRTINLTDAQTSAISKINDFAFNYFRNVSQLDGQKGKSTFSSPLSVTYLLGMLNTGAQGKTSQEIVSLLGAESGSTDEINKLCKILIDGAPLVDEKVALKLADCIVADNTTVLSKQYINDVSDFYSAETVSKSFLENTTLEYINNWCNEHTDGQVKNILDELTPDMRMIILNAVYFKAEWSGKFDKKETKNEAFNMLDGNQENIEMMHRLDVANYCYNNIYTTLNLPYGKGDKWNMYVLLPNNGKTTSDVIAQLTNDAWEKNKAMLKGNIVDVKLPKFKIQSDLSLNDVLISMGANTMFTPNADFSPMTINNEKLFVSMVKQKAGIEVSEEGTEASAVSVATMELTASDNGKGTPVVEFHANRPFVYIIQEASSGAIFFIGTFNG